MPQVASCRTTEQLWHHHTIGAIHLLCKRNVWKQYATYALLLFQNRIKVFSPSSSAGWVFQQTIKEENGKIRREKYTKIKTVAILQWTVLRSSSETRLSSKRQWSFLTYHYRVTNVLSAKTQKTSKPKLEVDNTKKKQIFLSSLKTPVIRKSVPHMQAVHPSGLPCPLHPNGHLFLTLLKLRRVLKGVCILHIQNPDR